MAVCGARDCTNEFTLGKYNPGQRFCSNTCWKRERYRSDPEVRERELARKHERYRSDPEVRERKRERGIERYWNLSGVEYNKLLLRNRRHKALRRMEERSQRLEVERLG